MARPSPSRPLLISFSGIDGAGKSTQISLLVAALAAADVRVVRLVFWDNVVVLPQFREAGSLMLLKGEKGVGTPEKPVRRRDKNVRTWYLTAFRFFIYLLDAAHLSLVIAKARNPLTEVVIFDRYLYDELANLPLENFAARTYVRWLLCMIPRPDLGLVLDAEPETACLRKPEYPVDFVHRHRKSYLTLASWATEMSVIAPGTPVEVQQRIQNAVRDRLPQRTARLLDLAQVSPML